MRIAFTSCVCTPAFRDQPVWDWIAARQPDHLVLLGDSIYLDVPITTRHPQDMGDDEFARHLHRLYTQLIQQTQFAALVRAMPAGRVWSIWDDHDFLWNDALGAELALNPQHREKIRLSTAFHEAFRAALAKGLAPGAFPDAHDRPVFWDLAQPPLSTPSIELEPGLWLHLADVRSHRTRTWLLAESKRALLGEPQQSRLGAAVEARPGAVHLLASGSTLSGWKRHYARDWRWLNGLAARQRMLVLSGDIHRNETDAFYTGGWPLHEATASGAAVRDAVILGQRRRNYGLLDVSPTWVEVSLFDDDRLEPRWSRRYDRATWLPV